MSSKLTLAEQAVRNMVIVIDGQAMTNSRWVAEVFGKRHDDVLKAIRNIECSDSFRLRNFAESSYLNGQGKEQPMVEISFKGFVKLVMGFNGSKAAIFQEAFIEEFERMRNEIVSLKRDQAMLELEQQKAYFEKYARFPTEPLTDERRLLVVQMLSEGYTIADAARLNRVTQKTVRILRDANLPAASNKDQGKLDLQGGAV